MLITFSEELTLNFGVAFHNQAVVALSPGLLRNFLLFLLKQKKRIIKICKKINAEMIKDQFMDILRISVR